jgi:hypothetical protein
MTVSGLAFSKAMNDSFGKFRGRIGTIEKTFLKIQNVLKSNDQ